MLVPMGLGHEANSVPTSTPLVDSDDMKQFLWLVPALMCWQGHALYSVFKEEVALPLLHYVL